MNIELRDAIIDTSRELGVDPVDLATVMSYETGGTFNSWKKGPTTRWGTHRGLIQWGVPQRNRYGVSKRTSIRDQVKAAGRYLRDAGVKPGMGLLDLYSAVNAGRVGRYGARDAKAGGAPGTVRDKVEQQMGGHRVKAERLINSAPKTMEVPPEALQRAPRPPAPLLAAPVGKVERAPLAPVRPATPVSAPLSMASPERFGPMTAPAAASVAPTMASPDIDPARFGRIAMGPDVPSPFRPDNLNYAGPHGLGGPGGLYVDGVPGQPLPLNAPMLPATPAVAPALPKLPPPKVIRTPPTVYAYPEAAPAPPPPPPALSAYDIYAGVPGTARASGGNTVTGDGYGNTSVTNKYGVTTVTTPSGNQSAGSVITGPLMGGGILGGGDSADGKPSLKDRARKAGGALGGAMLGGLLGPAGGLIGGLIGRELAKPNGGRIGDLLRGTQTIDTSKVGTVLGMKFGPTTTFAKGSGGLFPAAPAGGAQQSYLYPEIQSNRSLAEIRSTYGDQAARAVGSGRAGLW